MKVLISTGAAIVAAAAFNIVASAQATQPGGRTSPSTPGTPSTQSPSTASPSPPTTTTASAQQGQVTITGCIVREADYRRTQGAGAGGALGSGVGVNNEFILADATMGPGSAASGAASSTPSASTPSGSASTPSASASTSSRTGVGTSGSATTAAGANMTAFELTGAGEGQASQHVGRRVEITGRLKAAETTAAGPTGGPTAGAPPRGVDVASSDLKLREFEVASVRATTGTCASR